LDAPFIRPGELADDISDMYDVIMHAISYYESRGISYDSILLLQPTSPFRLVEDIRKAVKLYSDEIDMVVSVRTARYHPEALFIGKEDGFLERFMKSTAKRRQDVVNYYSYNGAIYLMNINSLRKHHYCNFSKIVKLEMDDNRSVDLDTENDWDFAEYLLEKRIVITDRIV
jgi:N-acylneuraminate cytidylyltransferase